MVNNKMISSLPRPVGAFFITWLSKLPTVPEQFNADFIIACHRHFRNCPTNVVVKKVERQFWFWWTGMTVTMILGWFLDNPVLQAANFGCVAVMLPVMIIFPWASFRRIKFAHWLCDISGHEDYRDIYIYTIHHKQKYPDLMPHERERLDSMEFFLSRLEECRDKVFS